MDEPDVTAAESKATYKEIRDYVWEHHQLKVSNLYIAQVKHCLLYTSPSPRDA